ncbi:rod-binding protein [bacterium]|nr:rod-binding protein [bacterium]
MSDMKIGRGGDFLQSASEKVRLARMEEAAKSLQRGTDAVSGEKEIGARSTKSDLARATEAAENFEGILVQQMMKSMWQSIPKNGLLSGSSEEQLYQEMLQQEVSAHISHHQSLGIKDMVMGELEKRGEVVREKMK